MAFSSFMYQLQGWIESTSPEIIYWIIVGSIWGVYAFKTFILLRQRRIYFQSHTHFPVAIASNMSPDDLEKARLYSIDKINFKILSDFCGIVILSAFLHFDGVFHSWHTTSYLTFWTSEMGRSIMLCLLICLVTEAINLPWTVYFTFYIEQHHGFNNQTLAFFATDLIKKFLLNVFILCGGVVCIVWLAQVGGQYFFLWLWIAWCVGMLLLVAIIPVLIMPLFDKYTPIQDGPLKNRIEALACRVSFPLSKLYVVEGSKRSSHSNAYQFGFCNNKRIVLYDTLIKGYRLNSKRDKKTDNNVDASDKGCTDEEIEAVVGHELAHWKYNHFVKNIAIKQVDLLLTFAFAGVLYKIHVLYEAFGFPRETMETPVVVGLFIIFRLVLFFYNGILSFVCNVASRRFEFNADAFAVKLGYGNQLKSALINLNKDNLGYPVHYWLYTAWFHSHPNLSQRIEAIDKELQTGNDLSLDL